VDQAAEPARRERGWRRLLAGLFAFLVLPLVPPLSLLLPVQQTLVLIVPALAACAVVGWRAGGRLAVALFWVAIATLVLFFQPAMRLLFDVTVPAPGPFDELVAGWSLVLSAGFGLVCLLSASRTFFVRALSAIGVAGLIGLAATSGSAGGVARVTGLMTEEFGRRAANFATQAAEQRASDDPLSKALRERGYENEIGRETRFFGTETAVALLPSLLALQSLAALGFAWALYHRFSRVRVGLPLAPLREFRFNDQLVWGLVAGLAFALLQALSGLRAPGLNMLLFFGTLYALRGMGVLAWFLAPDRLVMVPLVIFAVLAFPLFGAVALGLGLGDTWLDWRSRAARPAA
jgi:Predicted membrane protein (DUF2232)